MNATYMKKPGVIVFVLALTALACGPIDLVRDIVGNLPTRTPTPGISEAHEATFWYVATDGDNGNTCIFPDDPCLTIREAISRADDDDTIFVAAGTYNEVPQYGDPGTNALAINYTLKIQGDGAGSTILDGSGLYGVFQAFGDARVRIQDLTVQNASGNAPGSCIAASANATVIVEDVMVQNCIGHGIESSSTGTVTLINVNVTGTTQFEGSFGTGVFGTNFDIQGGEISGNQVNGISSFGTSTMTSTLVRNNGAFGVSISGTASLTDVTIRDNASGHLTNNYAGMEIVGGNVTMVDSDVLNNQDGIVVRDSSSLTLESSSVDANPRTGLSVRVNSVATLIQSTVSDNGSTYASTSIAAGIGVESDSVVTVRSSEITTNRNGGIRVEETGELIMTESSVNENVGGLPPIFNLGTANIERSLIANNQYPSSATIAEAAVVNEGTMTILNTTVSNNDGSGVSGGEGNLSISYSTIAENETVGLVASGGRDAFSSIANVIVASHGDRDCAFSVGATSTTPPLSGNNIDTDGSCAFPETYTPAELLLGALAANGGPTETHALLPDSPAIDAAMGSCPATDQRNAGRPNGAACDVGAYETGATPLAIEPPDIPIGTPTPPSGPPITVTTTISTPCYSGPGPQYGFVSNLAAGITTQLIGAGFTGNGNQDWVVADHPTAANTPCWLDADDVTPSIPFEQMRLIAVPDLPTPTPKPTSDRPPPQDEPDPCYYDANNVLICP